MAYLCIKNVLTAGAGHFSILDGTEGGGGDSSLHVFIRVQRIAFDDNSRLVVCLLILGRYSTELLEVKGEIFTKSAICQIYKPPSKKMVNRI